MRVSAKVDYAVRACLELASIDETPVKCERIAASQDIPVKFLENILVELRHAGIVTSQRGSEGGHSLARRPDDITIAAIMRAVEGPLANIRGVPPEEVTYSGAAAELGTVWVALRASIRAVLEEVTVGNLARGELPESVRSLTQAEGAWTAR